MTLLTTLTTSVAVYGQSTPSPDPARAVKAPAPKEETEGPWRLSNTVGSPKWFRFGAEHRSRGEYIIRQFRADRPGDGGLLSFRTAIRAEIQPGAFLAGVELMDARAYLANDVIALNTTHINPVELLQGYVGLVGKGMLEPDDEMKLRVGRITMDIGSRRLMARNRYRNTINTFTGFDAVYQREDGLRTEALGVFPVQRRPGDREALVDNDIVYDRETFDFIHSGVVVTLPPLSRWDIVLEGYAFGTVERDGEERATKDRRLLTPGFRFYREPVAGELDFTLEVVAQVGRSRASRASDDATDLTHLASFQHISAGYTANVFGEPRLALEYDHATGDDDPSDGQNNRFETLFGARRFDFGPTGIYGAVARANIRTPGVRLQWKPLKVLRGFVGYRALWLDEAADGWTTSGVTASPGRDATFVGHQVEARLRFDPWPENLRVEPGVAHLFPGAFLETSDTANDPTDTTMLYLQVVGKL